VRRGGAGVKRFWARAQVGGLSDLPRPGPGRLEIQIHPANIRRRVRYLFLSRARLTAWSLLGLAWLGFVAWAAFLAPGVVRGRFSGGEYQALSAERTQQGERLQELVGRLEQLAGRGEDLRRRTVKVELAYGLSEPPARPGTGRPQDRAAGEEGEEEGSIYGGLIRQGDRLRARLGERLQTSDRQLRRVRAFETAQPEVVRATPSICPLRGARFVLTSPFARHRSPFTRELTFHPGIDLAAPRGTPIRAAADGVVAFVGRYAQSGGAAWSRYGNLVVLRHGDRFVTIYGHCDTLAVRKGQTVERGQTIATVGSTGMSPTPHLHYEVRRRSAAGERPVDPRLLILDHTWPDEERLLTQAAAPWPAGNVYEPLPTAFLR
jgi:murein DD-endopeptidase MepM/ murein hydrolase activator NlpD